MHSLLYTEVAKQEYKGNGWILSKHELKLKP